MKVRKSKGLLALTAMGGLLLTLPAGISAAQTRTTPAQHATAALMSVAGPASPFPRNVQDEPAMAVDPIDPNVLAAASNDLVDMQACSRRASITEAACSTANGSFDLGIGMTGIYFSFNKGHRWIQPTYKGLTAVGCSPTVEPCKGKVGAIHTVPNYYEHGMGTQGNAFVAFGPVRKDGKFSWSNGSSLYVSTLAGNLNYTGVRPPTINSSYTVAVSHIDNPTASRVADQANWSKPVIVPSHESSSSYLGEDQIWADNAATSRYFGNVYVCYNNFVIPNKGDYYPIYPTVGVSSNGGQTWTTHIVAPPYDSYDRGYHLGCSVRTDSHGNVYVFWTHFHRGVFPNEGQTADQVMVKSYDGGATWTRPVTFLRGGNTCVYIDPIFDRCAMEGPAGARSDFSSTVSADIANGAPSGRHATNEIVATWSQRGSTKHAAEAMLSYSTNGGKSWSTPVRESLPGDQVMYTAAALSPNGSHLYLTYSAFTTPFTKSMSIPRLAHATLRSASIAADGAPIGWTTDYISPSGDVRGTAPADFNYGEFLGNIVSAIATNTYGAGAWTDPRGAADCPAMDKWRQASFDARKMLTPAPWPLAVCPADFGNTKLWSATTAP
jgi:hypothetical protein